MAEFPVPQHCPHDYTLESDTPHANPFFIRLEATFVHESGATIASLPGFYDGDGAWKVRFTPTLLGVWTGMTSSDDPQLDGIELTPLQCVPGSHMRVHGRVRIDPDHPHRFRFEDGTPFVPLGFECDWLFALHQVDPESCRTLIDLIARRGFNEIITNVYAHTGFSTAGDPHVYGPPKLYAFGGTNDEPDHSAMNVAFFRDFDRMMAYLHAKGIVVHLMIQVQNKKVRWAQRRSREDDLFWRYVVARYQAYGNLVWDVGKESYNLYRETGSHDYTLDRIGLIREADAYRHLVTVHDAVAGSNAHNSVVDDACDFVSDQIHLHDTALYNREAVRRWRLRDKPYVNIEYGYEEGAESLKTYRGGTTTTWEDVLLWTVAIYVGGGYPGYYYSNTSWDLIAYEPEPPGWARYQQLVALLSQVQINRMVPDNDFVDRGFCLAEPGEQYLVFLPEGGDVRLDLTAVLPDAPLEAEWMALYSGERRGERVDGRGFTTRLTNPLPDGQTPCVVLVRRQG
ncbi:DUF4038 domain-containing protein [Candidatus Poribacteria bacterium]|nr:DUF4038 domain-containing protein [Candidatus Poribacteria bacterium]